MIKMISFISLVFMMMNPYAPIPRGSGNPQGSEVSADAALSDIRPAYVLSSNERVVNNYDELRDALANDNGITTVYFGNDITMQMWGIEIHPGKTNITVNGINPLDPEQKYHTLTDYSSATITDTIYINTAGPKTLLIKNLIITGKNYYGPFCIYDNSALSDLVVTYDRVSYYGPQIGYHRNGLIRFSNCSLTISGGNGGSPNQEFSEAKHLVFEGTNYVDTSTSTTSAFWHPYGGSFKIANDASLTLTSFNTSTTFGLFYAGGAAYNVDIDIGERAVFDVTISGVVAPLANVTLRSFTVRKGGLFHLSTTKAPVEAVLSMGGNLTVDSGAKFIINGSGSPTYAVINQKTGDITVNKDATFHIIASGAYPRLINLYGRALICNDPASVLLYNANRLIEATTSSGRLYANAEQINYWSALSGGGLDAPPAYCWKKADKSNFWIDGTLSVGATSNFSGLTSNYVTGDQPDTKPSAASLNMVQSRVLALGRLELTVTAPPVKSSGVTGVTAPGAAVRVSFTQRGVNYTLPDATANSKGVFSVNTGVPLDASTIITVKSNYQYLTATTEVVVNNSGIIELTVPKKMEFYDTGITLDGNLAKRIDPDWHIVVSDTRGAGSEWSVYVRLAQPLTPLDNTKPVLTNALVFANSSVTPLTSSGLLIARHVSASGNEVNKIHWAADRGILIQVPVNIAYAETAYTGVIEWTLADVP